ncbi:MAG: amidohydrolase family protein [Acidimicrobiia bacterium]
MADHRRVDIHSHGIPPQLPTGPGAGFAGWPSVERSGDTAAVLVGGRPFRDIDSRCWSAARRIEDLDADGIDVQVVSPIPVTFCYDAPAAGAVFLARAQNDFLAGLVSEGGGRIAALGAVPLQDPQAAVAELERVAGDLRMAGVQIGTHVAGRELADPAFEEFFAASAELGALVFVHPGTLPAASRLAPLDLAFGVGMPCETALAAAQLIVGGILSRHPALRICLAHGGGALPMILGRLDRGWEILPGMADRLAERPSVTARRLYADSLTYDPDSLALVLSRFGGDHVMLGTDYPFAARETPPGAAVHAALAAGRCDDATCRAVLGGTASALLPLPERALTPAGDGRGEEMH